MLYCNPLDQRAALREDPGAGLGVAAAWPYARLGRRAAYIHKLRRKAGSMEAWDCPLARRVMSGGRLRRQALRLLERGGHRLACEAGKKAHTGKHTPRSSLRID